MSFAPTPADISVIITAASSSGSSSEPSFVNERRITPTWTLHQLKSKLETMTGVPPSAASLKLKNPGQDPVWMSGDERRVEEWGIFKGSEIEVHDSRPKSLQPNFTDLSSVEKYELPTSTYESLPNSVLAWKKNQKLGRFDPNALSPAEALKNQVEKDRFDISSRGIQISSRAIILPSTPPHIRRGVIRFIGPVPSIPLTGPARDLEKNGEKIPVENLPIWVGIELDEPTGKNDGSIAGKRYFECGEKRGAFVKPDKIEVGDFPPLSLEDEFDDLEEI